MGRNVSVSFRDEDENVWEWIEDQHKNGPFRSRSHVLVYCAKQIMKQRGDDEVMT